MKAVLFIALAAIYLFAFSVSVSLSRQYRRNTRLMQEIAILDKRLRDVENRLAQMNERRPEKETVPSSLTGQSFNGEHSLQECPPR